jgi:putative selenate reductase
MEQLTDWAFDELEHKDSLFGIPRSAFFEPSIYDRYRIEKYGQLLETPFGVAAGPATQMAQNIVVSWLVGARFLELKTIQTLDELDVNKPCIDCQDEGYNVEWSQELKVYESFDEYLRAWVLIHALHHKLGFDGDAPGMIFNMSVGYNLEGIHKPNVQWFFDTMADASAYKQQYIDIVAERYPEIRGIEIPDRLSDSITLSTMHGCPPDEIEGICNYLLDERSLNTSVKLNPTLLGPDGVRQIVNDNLGFTDVPIPDEAFGHDLWWKDAVPMLTRLWSKAKERELTFGVKLTNTLEVNNWRTVFPDDDMMYLSGRALHPVTANLALKISEEFPGLLFSFAGGADAFNVADLLRSGAKTITVCSDLLKSGGYMRLLQYFEELDAAMDAVAATSIDDFIARSAAGLEADDATDTTALARANLRRYAFAVRADPRYIKETYRTDRSKTTRHLDLFDCIEAPCQDACAVNQQVPQYMNAVRDGDFAKAVAITREDNPISAILGRVCDHLCETTCIRTHYDEPLAIREMKRFIMSHEAEPQLFPQADPIDTKVAVIGAGPAGIAAAEKLAYAGFGVTVFEMYPYPGGMVGGAIPVFRLPQAEIDQDMAVLDRLGVQVRYSTKAGVDFTLAGLREDGYEYTVIAVGAQLPKLLGLDDEDAEGVIDGIRFLRDVREGARPDIGDRVGVVGAGDTAMDCVRSAWRVGASDVSLIYRRTKDQMPADREEVHAATSEGVKIVELAKPTALHVENGKLAGLVCTRNEYRGDRDESGRKIPHEIPDSEFEVPLDTLILAISQHAILDFFGEEAPELTDRGYIATDPDTFETSVAGVLAVGDVSAHGPQSIVLAAGDGKAMADALIAKVKGTQKAAPVSNGHFDFHDLIKRRAHREYRTPVSFTPLDQRDNFNETIVTYTPEEAMAEAGRCLDCHEICSLCVGVCPNMALMTYQMEPFRTELPQVSVSGGEVLVGETSSWTVDQTYQIAVLTDFCNECGNCTTFCPTSGDPYRDKPRLYLDREDFEAQSDNAFMMFDDGAVAAMEGRWGGETHRIELNGDLRYESPALTARIDPKDFSVAEASPNGGGDPTLEPAASMYVMLKGLRESMPHIPTATPSGAPRPAGMIAHPGYEE